MLQCVLLMAERRTTKRHVRPREISISFETFMKAALVGVGLFFLWFIRDIVAIILVALLLAALIDPVAHWFHRHHIPRGFAVLIVYALLGAIGSLVLLVIVPVLVEQLAQMFVNLSSLVGQFSMYFEDLQSFAASHGFEQDLSTTVISFQDALAASVYSLFSTVEGIVGGIVALFVILVLAFYMVVEENSAKTFFQHIAPKKYQPRLAFILTEMKHKIGGWLRGQIILGLVVGVAVYIGLTILGVRYALALAIIAALFEIVPYVGPIAASVPAVIIGFAQSPVKGGLVLLLYFIIQQLEGNLLAPKIIQKVVGLNPIVGLVALLIGIKVGGIVGAILAIPVATMGAVLLENIFAQDTYVSS